MEGRPNPSHERPCSGQTQADRSLGPESALNADCLVVANKICCTPGRTCPTQGWGAESCGERKQSYERRGNSECNTSAACLWLQQSFHRWQHELTSRVDCTLSDPQPWPTFCCWGLPSTATTKMAPKGRGNWLKSPSLSKHDMASLPHVKMPPAGRAAVGSRAAGVSRKRAQQRNKLWNAAGVGIPLRIASGARPEAHAR